MNLTEQQKRIIEHVVNVFETGSTEGDYGAIATFEDGPDGVRQVTYGRSQTTEYGNLKELLQMYVDNQGKFSGEFPSYIKQIGIMPLAYNKEFHALLKKASDDIIMQQVQDEFFDKRYFKPAIAWADKNGFTLPLSALVIYDSFIHSGQVLIFLRKRFQEMVPIAGGYEKTWIKQYVETRHKWLANHSNKILRGTIYRTQCFKQLINDGNWELSKLPIKAHGVDVSC